MDRTVPGRAAQEESKTMRLTFLRLLPVVFLVACGQTPATIDIAPKAATLTAKDATAALTATVKDAKGEPIPGAQVTWTSGDAKVATVDASGKVTAVASGITAAKASINQVTAEAKVTVSIPSAIQVAGAEVILAGVGATADLAPTVVDETGATVPGAVVEWATDNMDVATVSGNTVTGVAKGTAMLKGTAGGASIDLKVTVQGPPAKEIQFDRPSVMVKVGATDKVTVTAIDQIGDAMTDPVVTWTSADPAVATVGPDGTVTGVARGTTTVTAQVGEVSKSLDVKVR
jgi:uncharacterized protein YjdB